MKHEVLDPVDEADIANAKNKANLPAPTSMGLTSQNVNTSPDAVHGQPTTTTAQDAASASGDHRQLHGEGHSASATGADNPAVAAAPFGGRLRVRNPYSGSIVRVPQYVPSQTTQTWYVCEVPGCGRRFQHKSSRTCVSHLITHCLPIISLLNTNLTKALQDSSPHDELSFGAMRP